MPSDVISGISNISLQNSSTSPPQDVVFSETSDRPLAYVETITDLSPIPGADVIEVASIRGWQVIVKKGLYSVGDRVVYCEIDSILPPWPYFIADRLDKVHFRIRTIKMRGQISQGYCIPFKELANHPDRSLELVTVGSSMALRDKVTGEEIPLELGADMTAFVGIRKYEVPDVAIQRVGKNGVPENLGPWPHFLCKTDQERIQNKGDYLETFKDFEFEVTEKLDGTSVTAFFYNGRTGVCSRNYEVLDVDTTTHEAAEHIRTVGVLPKLTAYGRNIALQGELHGVSLQGNWYKLKDRFWSVFDVWLIDERRHALPDERRAILRELELDSLVVPVIGRQKIDGCSVQQLLALAEGPSVLNKQVHREGLVFKSTSLYHGRVPSFKAISNSYLLNKG